MVAATSEQDPALLSRTAAGRGDLLPVTDAPFSPGAGRGRGGFAAMRFARSRRLARRRALVVWCRLAESGRLGRPTS